MGKDDTYMGEPTYEGIQLCKGCRSSLEDIGDGLFPSLKFIVWESYGELSSVDISSQCVFHFF